MDDVKRIAERAKRIDVIAAELKSIGNPAAMIDELAESAKRLLPGTAVHLPGKPLCVGYVSNCVSESLQVGVTSTLDNMNGAIFHAPAHLLEKTDDR